MRFFAVFLFLALTFVPAIILMDAWNVEAAELWRRKVVACAFALGFSAIAGLVWQLIGGWWSRLIGWAEWKAGMRRFPPS